MDQSAVGHDYIAKLEKHESQKDYATGFGGKFGVQTDRVDKVVLSEKPSDKCCRCFDEITYFVSLFFSLPRVLLDGITKKR